MWKNFFYYSKRERLAVMALLGVIAVLVCLIHVMPTVWRSNDSNALNTKETEAYRDFCASLEKRENVPRNFPRTGKNSYYANENGPAKHFAFNPNTADSATFLSLGLKPFIIRNILKYREKGGKFKSATDFAKVYGLNQRMFSELQAYIRIPVEEPPVYLQERQEMSKPVAPATIYARQEKYPQGTSVELNRSDTTELKKIPGIGSAFARRITSYRDRLGGFYSVEQLSEVWGITPEMYAQLSGWFTVDASLIKKLSVNQLTLEELRKHPYINYYRAKAFIDMRMKKGKLYSLDEFSLLDEFPEKEIRRLEHYLDFR
ncbi:MAG: helix-hairpin-helix domain-containing protein [Bacteroidales bacterium]|jgi:competence ComEA-like helix-hairpin-helix protein|nr:helix-hairpin-helix domain-containing protein [Bacteroidales bacterium]